MKTFINYLLKKQSKNFDSLNPFEIIQKIELKETGSNYKFFENSNVDKKDFLISCTNEILLKFVMQRCEDLGNDSKICQDGLIFKVKLFGQHSHFLDNSKWAILNKDQRFDSKINLKNDLMLNDSDIMKLIKDIIHFNNFHFKDKESEELTLYYINKGVLKNLNEIELFLIKLFENNKKI
jgi:hypothetical protein